MTSQDTTPDGRLKQSYGGLNVAVLAAVPSGARRVLDLGCGDGALGQAIKIRQAAELVGITYSPVEAGAARGRLDRVEVADLNQFDPAGLGQFDCVVCSHVLEHLYWPEKCLAAVRGILAPGGRLLVALPNVLAWRQRIAFLAGRFRYADGGLMDRTHFRFFDWQTAQELVRGAGYRVVSAAGDGVFPLAKRLPVLGWKVSRAAVRIAPGLFAWQFVIVAEPTP